MIANLILAVFTAALARWAGDLSIELAVFIGWVTFRLETTASSFTAMAGAAQAQAHIEHARLLREQAMYEQAVGVVAANN